MSNQTPELSVSLRPTLIDFEWNECGVDVMVNVGLMDIERRREWVRFDGGASFVEFHRCCVCHRQVVTLFGCQRIAADRFNAPSTCVAK